MPTTSCASMSTEAEVDSDFRDRSEEARDANDLDPTDDLDTTDFKSEFTFLPDLLLLLDLDLLLLDLLLLRSKSRCIWGQDAFGG